MMRQPRQLCICAGIGFGLAVVAAGIYVLFAFAAGGGCDALGAALCGLMSLQWFGAATAGYLLARLVDDRSAALKAILATPSLYFEIALLVVALVVREPDSLFMPKIVLLLGVLPCWGVTYLALRAARRAGVESAALRKANAGRCAACGYDLTGNVSGVCPECGQGITQPSRVGD